MHQLRDAKGHSGAGSYLHWERLIQVAFFATEIRDIDLAEAQKLRVWCSSYCQLTKLTALYLSCVTLSNLVLEGLLKGCPLLEDLVMEYFMCCSSLKIGSSSLKLKRLTIKVDHYVAIDVEAPNLQLMKIDVADFGRCSFKEMLFLRDAYFNASCAPTNPSKIHSSLNSSLHSLPHAGFLVLSSACLQVMPNPTFQDLPPSFFKTRSLIIKTGIQKYEIPGIANLLWSSPDLEIS
eukprot:TRINITY_DN2603_c0_g2_i3.p1 TRINITY_DN2603_c0_g2~~TRINITY_DN2603_c0_g2_i3.p1  ORF type:complete len:235 (+),score=26.81 TRINITY_DN2603_c0_g2_i3:467-1171(+)